MVQLRLDQHHCRKTVAYKMKLQNVVRLILQNTASCIVLPVLLWAHIFVEIIKQQRIVRQHRAHVLVLLPGSLRSGVVQQSLKWGVASSDLASDEVDAAYCVIIRECFLHTI